MIEIDELLSKCGDFHRYQWILLFLFCIINLLSSMHYYSQTIISFEPQHYWCYDEVTMLNLTHTEIKLMMIDGSKESSCYLYGNQTECSKYIYDFDFGYKSMTSELNWICGSAWKASLGQSMFFVGSCLGSLSLGFLADRIGRLPILLISNAIAMIGNLSTMFATTLIQFSICRFISGLATDSNFLMMYILVMEYIRPSMRTAGLSVCIGIFYCIGSVLTPWLAVYSKNWKIFLLFTSLPFVLVPFFALIVQESAQWLVTKKRYDKAVNCFRRVAQINGRIVDEMEYQMFIENCKRRIESSEENASLLGLFRTPRLRKHTLILFFKSMAITLAYDAISRNVQGFGVSPFIMFSVSATAIFPACMVLVLLQDKIGRKAMASSSLLICGIFTSATGAILIYQHSEQSDPYLLVALSFIGRFGVTVAYNSAGQYATELIPTCVRGQGVAAVHVAGYAFTFFSSYILLTQLIFKPFPAIVLGTLTLLGSGLCLLLPETLNKTLPVTLEAAEEFGRGERILDFSCWKRKQTSTSTAHLNDDTRTSI